jgi:UDP-N-acetylglucosamine 2-epimerase (non-hydrolysing)
VPEEINRKIVDHTADINLPYSSIAREYLLREGLSPDLIVKTGSPMFEVLTHYRLQIQKSGILAKLDLEKEQFFLISCHREENLESDEKVADLVSLMNDLSEKYKISIIVSTHPRTKNRLSQINLQLNDNIRLLQPLSFSDYNKLQLNAKVVLSDSGTINEESSILGFPAINLREAHERPEAMEQGAVMMCGFNATRVKQAIQILEKQYLDPLGANLKSVHDYSMPNVSEKVVSIIMSYTDYVNRVVWKKY